ncbi:MAG: helix-turn-helix domain-containing protein [Clostridia bacterium]|nr:helix-turn-helix domain-containing protein [Clostridia bacterium]
MAKLDITKNKMLISEYIETRKGFCVRRCIPFQRPRPSDGFIFILEGTCHYTFDDGTKFRVKKNDILYLAHNAVYQMDIDCDRYEFYVINFFFSNSELRQSAFYTPLLPSSAEQLFSRLCFARDTGSPAAFARDMTLIYKIMGLVTESAERVYMGGEARAKVERCADFIHLNFSENSLSVSALAKSISLSEVHFRKLFSRRFGISPAHYIIQTRINHALKLMELDEMTLDEIAERSGFASRPYFNKVFKRFLGETPAVYRRSLSKHSDVT